jgi:hypothetical protein
MKTSLDCVPCLVRQTIEASRLVSMEHCQQERLVRDVLRWASEMDMDGPPPLLAQRIQHRLRELSGIEDPYRALKDQQNRLILELLPELEAKLEASPDPLELAVRLAIAGNVIDLGVKGSLTELEVRQALEQAVTEIFVGDMEAFRQAVAEARNILYLADNAGEIALDRLLIEQLGPARVTVAVRGAPVFNDATRADARAVGLESRVKIIDNGSDAPGTLLADCSETFREEMTKADLILAKGQGNYETLCQAKGNLFFLFKVKCAVIADHAGVPLGAHVLVRPPSSAANSLCRWPRKEQD